MNRPARLSRTATLDEYYEWLKEMVDSSEQYQLLIEALHEKEFRYFVPNDDNRAFEGRQLREQFCDEMNIEYVESYFDFECTMLEMLIALSFRCEAIMSDKEFNVKAEEWFWKILHNVGLDDFTDDYYVWDAFAPNWNADEVDDILERIINRTYDKDGSGGLFPLNKSRKDQRKVEIWYQMNVYLVENYFSEE